MFQVPRSDSHQGSTSREEVHSISCLKGSEYLVYFSTSEGMGKKSFTYCFNDSFSVSNKILSQPIAQAPYMLKILSSVPQARCSQNSNMKRVSYCSYPFPKFWLSVLLKLVLTEQKKCIYQGEY